MLGRVVGVGPGRRLGDGSRARPAVGVGDRVIFHRLAGQTIELPDKSTISIMREDELLGVVEEEETT